MISRLGMVLIRACNKLAIFAVGFLFLFSFQISPLCQSINTKVVDDKPPLRYGLIVSKPTVCTGENITLELELENTSNHKVLIDPRALLHRVNFSRKGGARVPTGDPMGKIAADQFVALPTGQSYKRTVSYSLQDSFFSSTGIYRIQTTY